MSASMGRKGYTNRYVELAGCTRCGAVVSDKSIHDAWHKTLARADKPEAPVTD